MKKFCKIGDIIRLKYYIVIINFKNLKNLDFLTYKFRNIKYFMFVLYLSLILSYYPVFIQVLIYIEKLIYLYYQLNNSSGIIGN